MSKDLDFQFKCPSCASLYDVRSSIPAFSCGISKRKRIKAIFALCPACYRTHINQSGDHLSVEVNRIVRNVFSDLTDLDWSITTDLTLAFHGGCLVNAIIFGDDIPKVIFDAYNDGQIEDISFLPGGPYGLA